MSIKNNPNFPLFKELYDQYHSPLFTYLLSRTGVKVVAEDLLQEVFVKIWKSIEAVKNIPQEQRGYWIFRIAKNVSIDHYKQHSTQEKVIQEVQLHNSILHQNREDISKNIVHQETLEQVERELWLLEEEMRTILIMQVVEGLNSKEIGRLLDIPPGTVRYKLHLARVKLANSLRMRDEKEEMN